MKDRNKYILYPILAAAITGLDLFSKYLIRQNLILHKPVPVLGDFFRFTLVYNYGITFGMFNKGEGGASPVVLIILATLGLSAVVFFFLKVNQFIKDGRPQSLARLCLAFIMGGALGNIIDRAVFGRVTDFLDVGLGTVRWYTFNVADSFVVVGSIFLAVLMFFYEKKKPGTEKPAMED